jgi:hypothetical protein
VALSFVEPWRICIDLTSLGAMLQLLRHSGQGGNMFVVGIIFVALGLLYVRKPNLYRRGIWLKTSVAVRFLSEENYVRYMRGLGIALVVIGLSLVLWSAFIYVRSHG